MDRDEFIRMTKGTVLIAGDIETTGVSKDQDTIIEIGLVEVIEGRVSWEHSKMFGGGVSKPGALAAHGITDEERSGLVTFAEKAPRYRDFLLGVRKGNGIDLKTVIVGHNVKKFDIEFIVTACRRAGHPFPSGSKIYIADTLILARKYLSSPDHKLETLCKVYGIVHGGHRGLGDAKSSLNVLALCLEKAKAGNVIDICEEFTF
jgi:DNA polymerase III epsilon subunit-like protein